MQVSEAVIIPSAAFTGVPSFFRGCCHDASRGGTQTYSNAGWALANNIERMIPYGMDRDEWRESVDRLLEKLDDDAAALDWFIVHFSKCMKLVPRRRHSVFIEGVRRALEDYAIS